MNRSQNLLQMQQQAAARVREMEERSRRLVQEHPVNIYRGVTLAPLLERQPPPKAPPVSEETVTPVCDTPPPVCPPDTRKNSGSLSLFGGDNEQLLLLLIAAVLAKNGAPMELLLALLYVAL